MYFENPEGLDSLKFSLAEFNIYVSDRGFIEDLLCMFQTLSYSPEIHDE